MKKDKSNEEDREFKADDYITLSEAREKWKKKFPAADISRQSLLNWCKKYGIGFKSSPLLRAKFLINNSKFEQILQDPKKFMDSNHNEK